MYYYYYIHVCVFRSASSNKNESETQYITNFYWTLTSKNTLYDTTFNLFIYLSFKNFFYIYIF